MRGNGGELRHAIPPEPVLLTFSATPELKEWLRTRAALNDKSIQRQIREELEEHRVHCVRDRARRSA